MMLRFPHFRHRSQAGAILRASRAAQSADADTDVRPTYGNIPHQDDTEPRVDDGTSRADDEDGFTLVELMVVIVIIGLLATIVAVNVLPNLGKANTGKARSDVGTLAQGLEFYRLDNMTYPRTEQGLKALVTAPAGLAQPGRYRAGGYIKKLPDDPWGKPYEYANPGTHGGPFDIFSLGADGQPGGEGEDADIGSWQ